MGLLDQTQQQYYDGNDHGNYQFTSLDDIITQFQIAYVGENKIIPKIKRVDVAFHAQRAMQELSFDTLKSHKAQEIAVPATLQMILPQDYVDYTKISWVDSAGVKHPLYSTKHTQNPTSPLQDSDGEFKLKAIATLTAGQSSLVLDKVYTNILVGMRIYGEFIPEEAYVQRIVQNPTTTNITMTTTREGGEGAFVIGYTGDVEVYFIDPTTSSLIPKRETSFYIDDITWTQDTSYLTAGAGVDISNVKIGMKISTARNSSLMNAFPADTVVTDVQGTIIYVSNNATTNSSSSGNNKEQVTFLGDIDNSETWKNYKSTTPSENNNDDYEDDTYWPIDGSRFGLEPSHAQVNGSFFINQRLGKIHFSSNLSGKTVILDYISDSLGTDEEMQVHKFAEEAMYKWILHAIVSASFLPIHQQLAPRLKKEKFAAVRQAKLRLSNLKLEELTQILRGKSKWIKH